MLKPLVDPFFSTMSALELLQEEACRFVKKYTSELIEQQYPYYKQLNIIAQGNDIVKQEMITFINDRRAECDSKEAVINACADVNTLEFLSFLAPWVKEKQKLEDPSQ
jgi:hypothetical protein